MSKQPNPTLIGAFALGGAALLVLFIVIITGDALLSKRERYVMYFDGSIKGLAIGSNVMFRGVPIGFVSNIEVLADTRRGEFDVPVYVDINENAIKGISDNPLDDGELLDELIARGLRAQLDTESLITGKLFVQLDFHSDTEPVYRHSRGDYREIPTIPSGIQALLAGVESFMSKLEENVDIPTLAASVANAVKGINELANSDDLRESLAGANRLLNSDETQRISTELNQTLAALRNTLSSTDVTIEEVRSEIVPLVQSLGNTLETAEEVLRDAADGFSEQSALNYRLTGTLREVESAARSLRNLADYLERDPAAILRGRGEE